MDKSELSLAVGVPGTLTATLQPSNATEKTVNWTSSDPKVATVRGGSGTATITPLSEGEAVITATTANGKSATCAITVSEASPVSIYLRPNSITFKRGDNPRTIVATVNPMGASQKVTFESKDTSVVTVDAATGLATPKAPGETDIVVTSAVDSSVTGTCHVVVSGIAFEGNIESLTIMEFKSRDLTLVNHGLGYGEAQTMDLGWQSSDPSVVTVAGGRITGRSVGRAIITASRGFYEAQCEVIVKENTSGLTELSGTYSPGKPLRFSDIISDLQSEAKTALTQNEARGDKSLSYVTNMAVPTEQGVLYHGYISAADTGSGVAVTEKYYVNSSLGQASLKDVTFVPKADYSGTIEIAYTGYNAQKEFYSGRIRLQAEGEDDVSYATVANNVVNFQIDDFNNVCRLHTGRSLDYITFDLPASNRGTLYYNYNEHAVYLEKVTANTKYYYNNKTPRLSQVSFLPAEDYSGTVRITYRAYDTAGASFTGRLTITVSNYTTSNDGDVRYTARSGQKVTFKSSDFNTACQNVTGNRLNYVRFTLPDSKVGTLYYNYTSSTNYGGRVNTTTRYNRSGTPSLSNVSFVPASGTTGRVVIDFVAYDEDGERFEGEVVIQYDGDNNGNSEVVYTVREGRTVSFEGADFNEVCLDVTGRNLERISFTDLPAASRGTLYYNYKSSSNVGTKVSTSSYYRRTSGSLISNLTFVAKSGFTGTATLEFTGYAVGGETFTGTVSIRVIEAGVSSGDVTYSVRSGGTVTFDAADFNDFCVDETDSSLNYVRFELPATNRGTLYYNYRNSSNVGTKVTANSSYYYSSGTRLLDNITFLAPDSYSGTVNIKYTGYSKMGQKYDGVVQILVNTPSVSTIYYSGSSQPVALKASDFSRVCNSALSGSLSYIQFNSLPSSGQLYLNYNASTSSGTQVSTGTRYYVSGNPNIGQISYVPQYGYKGNFALTYSGVDTSGEKVTGRVEFSMSGVTTSSFSDMGGYDWANSAVEYLYSKNVVSGVSANEFGPGLAIRRCDFVVMLCRAFQLSSGNSSTYSFPDVSSGSYYASAVATAKDLGITAGINGRFYPTDLITRQDAMLMTQKAMEVTGWSVADGARVDLTGFKDNQSIAPYARSAIGTMVRLGAVSGDDSGCLRPNSSITRSEIAMILYRVMTL